MSNKFVSLHVPPWLSLGAQPFSQISAYYHYCLTEGSCSISSYSNDWGWSAIQVSHFIAMIQANWHSTCNINNNSRCSHHSSTSDGNGKDIVVVGNNNNRSFNNTPTTTATHNRYITLNDSNIAVEQTVQDHLYKYIINNTKCIDLLSYWYDLYCQHGASIDCIEGKQLAVVSKVVRTGNDDKARRILIWAFNSDCGKASFLRSKNYLFPSSLLNGNVLMENWNRAKVFNDEVKQDTSFVQLSAIPQFDSNGNIIE